MLDKPGNLGTDPYKGVRDFYPEDMALLRSLFALLRETAERYGYTEYGASILEPTDLYTSKTSEEIVKEQTYTFEDRGGRSVTLRPEMTPTLARMVAARRRELPFPLRWYSIPNLFRYEQPQRGRVREHYQLNVDMIGVPGLEAEIEVITVASRILQVFEAQANDFEIRINNRKLIAALFRDYLGLSDEVYRKVIRLLDKKDKIGEEKTLMELKALLTDTEEQKISELFSLMASSDVADFSGRMPQLPAAVAALQEIQEVMLGLHAAGVSNTRFAPSLMRGFDYYTGIVFEVFDTSPDNRRSLFGGGRYDDLLSIFGVEKIPAFGFGMGDVTLRDFLETHDLLPVLKPFIDLYICRAEGVSPDFVSTVAETARSSGARVAVDYTGKKIGDQIRIADHQGARYVLCVGEREMQGGPLVVKELLSGTETEITLPKLAEFVQTAG